MVRWHLQELKDSRKRHLGPGVPGVISFLSSERMSEWYLCTLRFKIVDGDGGDLRGKARQGRATRHSQQFPCQQYRGLLLEGPNALMWLFLAKADLGVAIFDEHTRQRPT